MDTVGKQFLISGRVQGVGYRNFVRGQARARELSGWVRNLNDGRVEVVVWGDCEKVMELAATLREGPPLARVDHMEELEGVSGQKPFPFRVR